MIILCTSSKSLRIVSVITRPRQYSRNCIRAILRIPSGIYDVLYLCKCHGDACDKSTATSNEVGPNSGQALWSIHEN